MEQTCPRCGLVEPAHAYCSRCGMTTTEFDWWTPEDEAEADSEEDVA